MSVMAQLNQFHSFHQSSLPNGKIDWEWIEIEEQWAPSGIWIVKNEQFNKAREKKAGPAIVFDFGLVMGGSCRTATSQKRRLAPGTKPLSFLQQTPNQQFLAVAGKAKELFEFGLVFEWESGPVELFYWWVMGRSPSTAAELHSKEIQSFLLHFVILAFFN